MSILRKVSFMMFLIVILVLLAFSVLYLTRAKFMPYHADAVGFSWEQVSAGFQVLILGFMRAAGGGFLSTALALGFLLLVPFRKGEKWAALAILLVGMANLIATLVATISIAMATPANPPWTLLIVGCVLLIGGFVLTLFDKNKK